jgi:phage-related protein
MQTVIFMGSSLDDIRAFPEATRRAMGRQILRLQHGLDPEDWKPMKTVGPGVREIRIHVGGQYRAFYATHIGNAIYILHAFRKKTQKTSPNDLALGQQRFKQIGG